MSAFVCVCVARIPVHITDTMVRSESGTVVVNSEVNTLVDSELGTMVINESDDDATMKRECRGGGGASGWSHRSPGWSHRAPGWSHRAPEWSYRAPGWMEPQGTRANLRGTRLDPGGTRVAPGEVPGWIQGYQGGTG